MTLQELNNLTLDDRLFQVAERLVDFSSVPQGEAPYRLEDGESKYDQLRLYGDLVKPSLEQFQAEFAIYKQELIDLEEARLAEAARVEDIINRFNSLQDVYRVISEAGYQIGNPALEMKRIIQENDQARLAEYEAISNGLVNRINQEQINKEAREYLAKTDWVILKALERGIPIPGDIMNARQQARDRVID